MNKKKLSVVMAGAMLATSVAPVLAAETTATEIGLSKKSLLQKEILDLAKTEMISTNTELKKATYVNTTDVTPLMVPNASAYGIKVLNKDGIAVALNTVGGSVSETVTYDTEEISDILATTNDDLKSDMTVQVVKRDTNKFLGQIIPGSPISVKKEADKFEADNFKSVSDFSTAAGLNLNGNGEEQTNKFIKSVKVDTEKATATITLAAFKNISNEKEGNVTIDVKVGSEKLNFNLPLDKDGNLINTELNNDSRVQECASFPLAETYNVAQKIEKAPKVEKEYKLVDDSAKVEEVTYLANELYDGLALTAKGTEIQLDLENAKKENERTGNALTVELSSSVPTLSNGVASFTVTYFASHKDNVSNNQNDKPSKVVTIKSTNLEEVKSLYNMLKDGSYEVGVVAGANRYETAVNVAKAQKLAKLSTSTATAKKENNIVLVNGNSLVDGLAAAPLAASLKWNDTTVGTAVLLSKADSLPTATKEYLEELTSEIPVSRRQYVTINLVGGESVLSESLVAELEDMGFSVERYGGANREETSLEVATAVKPDDTKGVFVVGANGEADAMSIAAVAAKENAPIIVAKAGGLSNDAIKFIKNNYSAAADGKIAVIGGEKAVSKAEYDKIDAVVEHKVDRVSGENRFETNAKIIEKYAKSFTEVILVKDGQANKDELIDALSSANYAAKGTNAAPIVLATDKITDAQKVAILDKKGNVTKLTQVGQGVARTTLESVAEFLGLSNVK